MSAAAIKRELGKVKLEARKAPSNDEPDSASDTESDMTELGSDEDEPEYYPGASSTPPPGRKRRDTEAGGSEEAEEIDAIKWARYRDSHEDRDDGIEGWHYGVMWTGYLKSWSDTEEFYTCFTLDDTGRNQMLEDFWNALKRPMRDDPDGEGRIEPEGKIGELLLPPKQLAKRWINDARPRRSYPLFLRRQKKEAKQQKIQKRDSDYYWLRTLKRQGEQAKKAAEQKQRAASASASASGSKAPASSGSRTNIAKKIKSSSTAKSKSVVSSSTDTDSDSDDEEAKKKAKERKEKAAAAKLQDLFEEPKPAKKEGSQSKEHDPLFSDDEDQGPTPAPATTKPDEGEDKKRKAETPVPATSAKGSRGPSPPKKAKSPEKQDATPAPKSAPPTSTPAGPSSLSGPSTSKTITTTPAVPAQQEPLFLESAPSPYDTFGTPIPGIFDAPSPASQPAATPASKVTFAEPAKDTLQAPSIPITVTSATPLPHMPTIAPRTQPVDLSLPPPTDSTLKSKKTASPPVAPQPPVASTSSAVQTQIQAPAVTQAPREKSATPLEPGEVAVPKVAENIIASPSQAPAPVPARSPAAPLSPLKSPRAQPPQLSPPPPPQSITPPRYGNSRSPERPASSTRTISPTSGASPIRPTIPLSDRPKYVQPSRIQVMAAVVDPEAEAKRLKMQARKGSHSHPSHPSLPVRPPNIVPPTASGSTQTQPKGPTSAPPRSLQSPFSIHNRPPPSAPAGPSSAPMQPKSWSGYLPPTAPAAQMQGGRPPSNYGGYGGTPLPDQKAAYKQMAPWQQRQQSGGAGNLSPPGPMGNNTPMWGGASPVAHTSAAGSNLSPVWSPNAASGPSTRPNFYLQNMRSPLHGPPVPQTPQAVDPRSANASPIVPQQSLPQAPAAFDPRRGSASATPSVDPRRTSGPSAVPQTPLLNVPASPNSRSSASGSRRVETLSTLALRLDPQEPRQHVLVLRGAMPGQQPDGDAVLAQTFTGPDKRTVNLDPIDLSLVQWHLRQGARVAQWAKLGLDRDANTQARWDDFKRKVVQHQQTWISYTEHLLEDNTVTGHYALVVTAAVNVEAALVGPGLGLGPWANTQEAGVALLVIALPLDSAMPPSLPNPVRPDAYTKGEDKFNMAMDQLHILASYGLTPEFFVSLTGVRATTYPLSEVERDLFSWIDHELRQKKALPPINEHRPEVVIFNNSKMARAVQSNTLRNTANRRTRFYAVGPALHLAPAQWSLTEIWKTGGLVTFSPTFILRSPDKFAEIMKTVRTAPNWAAYVIPDVVQWVEASWQDPARCPKPSKAFQIFTKALFLDQNLLHISGSRAASGGGLAVSTCPPAYAQMDKCARWMEWLARASSQTDYKSLVGLCFDYDRFVNATAAGKGAMDMDIDVAVKDLDLIDIETKQMEDLTAMRTRPDILPYRRCIHIGEVSVPSEKRAKLGQGIECVDPESFAAILSGAV